MNLISKLWAFGLLLLAASPVAVAQPAQASGGTASNATAPAVTPPAGTNSIGPRICFATNIFDFGRARSGPVVKGSFVFTNTGDQLLAVSNVTGCGCMNFAGWTKTVEPGQTGTIPVVLETINFTGPLGKTIGVQSNDKAQPLTVLQLRGTLWKELEVTPTIAALSMTADGPARPTTVLITNNTPEPISLSPPESSEARLTAELKTNLPGYSYQVVIAPVPPLAPGTVYGTITLKTSSTNTPSVAVRVYANVAPSLIVIPPQVALPEAQPGTKTTATIAIQNNSTNRLTLSEPLVNSKDVQADLKELSPGRYFTITLSFAPGFQVPPGEQVAFSVKTSSPKYPLIKVPILPPARKDVPPAAPAQQPAARPPSPAPPPTQSHAAAH